MASSKRHIWLILLATSLLFRPVSGISQKLIGETLFKVTMSALGSMATDKAMKEMGMGPEAALQAIGEELKKLRQSVSDIDQKLDLSNYLGSYRDANALTANIEANRVTVKMWQDDGTMPTTGMVSQMYKDLNSDIGELDKILLDVHSGVIPLFMKLHRWPVVSDQYQYIHDLDTLREYFRSSLATAVATLETMARIVNPPGVTRRNLQQQTSMMRGTAPTNTTDIQIEFETDTASRKLATVFEGNSASACRHNTNGAGGPHDPAASGSSNKYFDVEERVYSLKSCQDKCTARGGSCVGVEYGFNNKRCELWKANIGWSKPSSGYGCYQKVTKEEPTSPPVDTSCRQLCGNALPHFFRHAKTIVKGMYQFGVPLVENRNNAGFVHVRHHYWAIGPTDSDTFSGYRAGASHSRLGTKLETAVAAHDPAKDNGRSLEQLFKDNRIETQYVDYNAWKCSRAGGIANQGEEIWVLETALLKISGNSYKRQKIYLTFEHESSSTCNSRLNQMKGQYGLNRGQAYYTVGCFDSDLCHEFGVDGRVSVTSRIYGYFVTFNLKSDDANRMCTQNRCNSCGPGGKGCNFSGDRIDVGGWAMLKSEAAVTEYLGW